MVTKHMPPASIPDRVIPVAGAILLTGSCFVLIFWAIGRLMPWFLNSPQSGGARLWPAISILFISVGGWMRGRRRAKGPTPFDKRSRFGMGH
jgi:hypothetical protein